MKKFLVTFALVIGLVSMTSANATLIDRGGGMIYDDVLDITWLQDANYASTSGYVAGGVMTYLEAKVWSESLTYGGYDDWRLPEVRPVSGLNHLSTSSYDTHDSYDGSTDVGYNNGSVYSELGNMYYATLGNIGAFDTSGNPLGCATSSSNPCLSNTDIFENVVPNIYWAISGYNGYSNSNISAFLFSYLGGYQNFTSATRGGYAWAVRDGDVLNVIPIPDALEALIIKVFEMDLNVGLTKRLVDILEDALVAFDEGGEANALAVVNLLEDFIQLVEKKREKKITNEQADSLVADAVAIIEQITNPVEPPVE